MSKLTLKDIVFGIQGLAEWIPSPMVSPLAGKTYAIKGHEYELRMGIYQVLKKGYASTPLSTFIKTFNIEGLRPKIYDEGYGPIDFLMEPKNLREQGIFIRFSLRMIKGG